MAKIQDLRSITPRSNGTRSKSQVKNIARHHSATDDGDWFTFWPYWNKIRGWGTGGYHEIIKRDGTVQHCYDDHEITNGVANLNTGIYHICIVGNGSFTAAQEAAWDERCRAAMKRFNLPVSAVKGHNEFPGTSTTCPGINMNLVRSRLNGAPVPVSRDYLMDGDSNSAVAKLQKDLNKTGIKPPLETDGIFGAATEKAVKSFQKANGLEVDGIWGKNSAAKMTVILEQLEKPVVTPAPPAAPATKPEEDDQVKEAIVIGSSADYGSAEVLSIRKKVGIYPKGGLPDNKLEHVYLVGATKDGIQSAKFTDLSGKTRFETSENVEQHIKK